MSGDLTESPVEKRDSFFIKQLGVANYLLKNTFKSLKRLESAQNFFPMSLFIMNPDFFGVILFSCGVFEKLPGSRRGLFFFTVLPTF